MYFTYAEVSLKEVELSGFNIVGRMDFNESAMRIYL